MSFGERSIAFSGEPRIALTSSGVWPRATVFVAVAASVAGPRAAFSAAATSRALTSPGAFSSNATTTTLANFVERIVPSRRTYYFTSAPGGALGGTGAVAKLTYFHIANSWPEIFLSVSWSDCAKSLSAYENIPRNVNANNHFIISAGVHARSLGWRFLERRRWAIDVKDPAEPTRWGWEQSIRWILSGALRRRCDKRSAGHLAAIGSDPGNRTTRWA